MTRRYVACGVAAVGLVVAAATVNGYRTQGRSAFYQNALLGFGLHGLGHLGTSLLTRSYASGAATSPTIVLPFWLWATRALNQAGVPNRRSVPAAIALTAGSIAAGHLVASLLTKNRPRTVSGGSPRPKALRHADYQQFQGPLSPTCLPLYDRCLASPGRQSVALISAAQM